MSRSSRCLVFCLLALGCHGHRDSVRVRETTARVYNAIDFGMISSAHFVVSRVDGVVVHRKFDRDEFVPVTPGKRELRVRFYSESVTSDGRGKDECRLDLVAEAGRDYYLEGATEDAWWRARLVDLDGGGEIPCRFDDGAQRGEVEGGRPSYAVSSRPASRELGETQPVLGPVATTAPAQPAAPSQPDAPSQPAAPATGIAEAAAAVPSTEAEEARAAVPSTEAGEAIAAVPSTEAEEAAVAVPVSPGLAAAVRPRSEKSSPAVAEAKPAARSKGESLLGKVMRGRGHWGCPSSLFRVSAIEGEAIALGGDERVRLLGVEPAAGDAYAKALERAIGACVSLDYEPALAGRIHRDREGRLMVYMIDESGALLNAEVIRLGAAKVDPQSRCRRMGELLAAQSEAIAAGRGIWAKP